MQKTYLALLTLSLFSYVALADTLKPQVLGTPGAVPNGPSGGAPSAPSAPTLNPSAPTNPNALTPEEREQTKDDPEYQKAAEKSAAEQELASEEGRYYDGPSGVGGQYYGPGKMEKCDAAAASAGSVTKKAFDEALAFREKCSLANRGDSQKVVVNNYSTQPSFMYIFDLKGNCLGKTMVAYGNGAGGKQLACSDDKSHMTPPGFHLTGLHNGGKYNNSNSLKMVGLQGQNSANRQVLIHPARAPGTSSTWGCSGVSYSAINAVLKSLGKGALVYNYFQPSQMASNCRNKAGTNNTAMCRMDSGSAVPESATGQGAPSVTRLFAWIEEAHAADFPERLKIKKGSEITIFRYLKLSDTYEVEMTNEKAQGPNVATPEELKKALAIEGSLKDFKRQMARDNSAIYVLKKDLPLLWEEEIFKRQRKKK